VSCRLTVGVRTDRERHPARPSGLSARVDDGKPKGGPAARLSAAFSSGSRVSVQEGWWLHAPASDRTWQFVVPFHEVLPPEAKAPETKELSRGEQYRAALDATAGTTCSQVARLFGVSRAAVTQALARSSRGQPNPLKADKVSHPNRK
jgi:hypothetical protein